MNTSNQQNCRGDSAYNIAPTESVVAIEIETKDLVGLSGVIENLRKIPGVVHIHVKVSL